MLLAFNVPPPKKPREIGKSNTWAKNTGINPNDDHWFDQYNESSNT